MSQEWTSQERDMTPVTSFLESERNSRLGWKKAVAELVDNSFDASANQVTLDFAAKLFSITDDGRGVRDLQAILRMGDHRRQRKDTLGRYGVGAKQAFLWAWGETLIATNYDDSICRAHVKWAEVERDGKWRFTEQRCEATPETCAACGISVGHGTKITLRNHEQKLPAVDDLVEYLSYQFSPAISQGRQILINFKTKRIVVPEFRKPALEFPIDRLLEVEGRQLRVWAGVVPSGQPNPKPGFTIVHRHRVIRAGVADGCGENFSDRFFGWVELIGDGWKLAVNKDAIHETQEDSLYAALEECCREQLNRATLESRDVALSGLEASVSKAVTDSLCEQKKKRAKRDRTNKTKSGTVASQDTDREHRAATAVQDGEKSMLGPCPDKIGGAVRKIGDKVTVRFSDSGTGELAGRVDANGKAVVVTLYLTHPAVTFAVNTSGTEFLSLLTASLVAMYAMTTDAKTGQRLLPLPVEDRGMTERLWIALSALTSGIAPKVEVESGVT
jgi:hypothetical protein